MASLRDGDRGHPVPWGANPKAQDRTLSTCQPLTRWSHSGVPSLRKVRWSRSRRAIGSSRSEGLDGAAAPSYDLHFSHFSARLGSWLEAAVLRTNPGALDLAHPHPRFSKHLKTKLRTQPRPPGTCLYASRSCSISTTWNQSSHSGPIKQTREAWEPCPNTHTLFSDTVLPIWPGAASVSTAGTAWLNTQTLTKVLCAQRPEVGTPLGYPASPQTLN